MINGTFASDGTIIQGDGSHGQERTGGRLAGAYFSWLERLPVAQEIAGSSPAALSWQRSVSLTGCTNRYRETRLY